jgi:hypothetical protein
VTNACRNLVRAAVLLSGAACLGDPPRDLGLVERAERSIVQLTVRIRPLVPEDRSRAAHLTKADFSVFLDDKEFPPEQFDLDNFCPEPGAEQPPEADASGKHVLFFVDELGPESQINTKAMLQNMIPRMAADGYEMKVLPNSDPSWTRDVPRLLRDAKAVFDPAASVTEDGGGPPENDLRALLDSNQVDRAIELARRAELAAQLTFEGPPLQLARAISEMGPLPAPKALIYFAEFGISFREMIVDTAIRSGVAVYAVKADGLAPYIPNVKLVDDPGAIITTSLSSLSEHTGGHLSLGHFRKSASASVLKRVESDLSCVYVVSLDAAGLDRDRTLRPRIKLRSDLRAQLSAATIPELTIPSERRRQEDAVAITLRSGRGPGVEPAGVSLVPLNFDASSVIGVIRFRLDRGEDASLLHAAWDVGVNYFGASRVSGHGGLRVTAGEPTFVFEKHVTLPIGPYSIVGVAQEVGGPGLARGTLAGVLMRPKKNAVGFLQPPALLEWRPGTFVSEDGKARKAGWSPLCYGMAASDRPISIVASTCRGERVRGALTIDTTVRLPDKELRMTTKRWPDRVAACRIDSDVIMAGALPWSNRPYEAIVLVNVSDASGRSVARGSNAFWVIGPSVTAASRASAP